MPSEKATAVEQVRGRQMMGWGCKCMHWWKWFVSSARI